MALATFEEDFCCILSHHHKFSIFPGIKNTLNIASRLLLHEMPGSSVSVECKQLLIVHTRGVVGLGFLSVNTPSA